ncbi:hypothetical protein M3686_04735 [Micrococcus luteus]|uniref:hypothetical protein n=1 Tax=Micrococcus luteus TaxID=1270 RepID=UPI002040FA41|nr:hypothetical protein [Micrococcus luteus]MCM3577440.1 hypothetical protein [Micrococcus luteus]
MSTENTSVLPGFEQIGTPPNALAAAAEELIKRLHEQQLIEAHHVLTVQLVRELAGVMGKAAAKGQAAAMALASKELREAMAMLPQPANADDALTTFMAKFDEAAAR